MTPHPSGKPGGIFVALSVYFLAIIWYNDVERR